jgi:ribosomal protein S21
MARKDKPKAIGLEVYVNTSGDPRKDKEAVEFALRDFKKKIKKSGLMQELKMREAYMTPSKYKKFKSNESIKQRMRDQRKADSSRNNTDW